MSTTVAASLSLNEVAMRASDDLLFRMSLRDSPQETTSRLNIDETARQALISRKPREIRGCFSNVSSAEIYVATGVWISTNTVVVVL